MNCELVGQLKAINHKDLVKLLNLNSLFLSISNSYYADPTCNENVMCTRVSLKDLELKFNTNHTFSELSNKNMLCLSQPQRDFGFLSSLNPQFRQSDIANHLSAINDVEGLNESVNARHTNQKKLSMTH